MRLNCKMHLTECACVEADKPRGAKRAIKLQIIANFMAVSGERLS